MEFRCLEPYLEMGFVHSLESSFGCGFGLGFGSEFRARSKFGVRVWSLGQSLGLARVGGQSLGQSLGAEFDLECGKKLKFPSSPLFIPSAQSL